jgi:polysaccharide biosynthesis protein VpsF
MTALTTAPLTTAPMPGRALRVAIVAPPQAAAVPVLGAAGFALVLAGVLLRMNLSANMFAAAGIPYAQDGGNPLIKIHPGTWLILLVLGCQIARDTVQGRSWLLGRDGTPAWFMAMIAACILHTLLSTGLSGVAVYVDSYFCAGAAAALLQTATQAQRRVLGCAILAALLGNITIGLAETAVQANLFAALSDDFNRLQQEAAEFRAQALFDHPLTGAMLCILGVFLGLAATRRPVPRLLLLAMLMLGLLAFGGRAALATTIVALMLLGGVLLLRRVATRRLGLQAGIATVAAAILLGLAGWLVLTETSLGARILAHLSFDDSAAARTVQWRTLFLLDERQVLLGSSIDQVRQMEFALGQDAPFSDIEDFWLASFVSLGTVGFAFFLAGMLPFLAWLWRVGMFWGRCMLATFLVVASTSNTLSRKSDLLVLLVAGILASTGFADRNPVAGGAARNPVAGDAAHNPEEGR